jgi:ABC-type sugar transport system substrate-binding protein
MRRPAIRPFSAAVAMFTIILIVLAGGDCGPPTDARIERPDEFAVAFVGAGRNDPLWPVLRAGAERYVHEFQLPGIRIDAPRVSSPSDQIALLKTLLGEGYRGVCVQVNDPSVLDPVIRQLCSAGVRVITMVNDTAPEVRSASCGVNNAALGRRLAEAVVELLDGEGSIIVIHAGEQHPVLGDRLWAFRTAITGQPAIKTYFWLNCHDRPAEAERLVRDHAQRYPNLDAFVSLDNWPIRFLQGKPRLLPEGCKLVTVGGDPSYWRYIEDGTIGAMVEARHANTGFEAVRLCEKAIQNETIFVERNELPLEIVTPDTLDAFRVSWIEWSTPPK